MVMVEELVFDDGYDERNAEAHNNTLRRAQNALENQYNDVDVGTAAEAYIALEDKVNDVLGNEGTPVPPRQKQVNSVLQSLEEGQSVSEAIENIPMNRTDREAPGVYVDDDRDMNNEYRVESLDFNSTGVPDELPDLEEEDSLSLDLRL